MSDISRMPSDLTIDDDLLAEAHRLSGLTKPEDTIQQALREYVQRREQLKILDLFGTIDLDDDVHPAD
jgi:Arc/MetJ family transcription regulator